MDESLPALHLKLLEMCHETVELVMFFPLNLLPPPCAFPTPAAILLSLIASQWIASAIRSYAVVVEMKGQIERVLIFVKL